MITAQISMKATPEPLKRHKPADFHKTLQAFRCHPGRCMRVLAAVDRLHGLLLRKDFPRGCHLGDDA